jgi:hypothetical protein
MNVSDYLTRNYLHIISIYCSSFHTLLPPATPDSMKPQGLTNSRIRSVIQMSIMNIINLLSSATCKTNSLQQFKYSYYLIILPYLTVPITSSDNLNGTLAL